MGMTQAYLNYLENGKRRLTCCRRNLPEDYVSRLTDMAPGEFKLLKLLVPDPYDSILSKLERNAAKDRDDTDFLFRSQKLDAGILRDRYKNELRHNLIGNVDWHDTTLELWIEIFGSKTG
jgi:hypothetical protein